MQVKIFNGFTDTKMAYRENDNGKRLIVKCSEASQWFVYSYFVLSTTVIFPFFNLPPFLLFFCVFELSSVCCLFNGNKSVVAVVVNFFWRFFSFYFHFFTLLPFIVHSLLRIVFDVDCKFAWWLSLRLLHRYSTALYAHKMAVRVWWLRCKYRECTKIQQQV